MFDVCTCLYMKLNNNQTNTISSTLTPTSQHGDTGVGVFRGVREVNTGSLPPSQPVSCHPPPSGSSFLPASPSVHPAHLHTSPSLDTRGSSVPWRDSASSLCSWCFPPLCSAARARRPGVGPATRTASAGQRTASTRPWAACSERTTSGGCTRSVWGCGAGSSRLGSRSTQGGRLHWGLDRKPARPGLAIQFHGCHFEKLARYPIFDPATEGVRWREGTGSMHVRCCIRFYFHVHQGGGGIFSSIVLCGTSHT